MSSIERHRMEELNDSDILNNKEEDNTMGSKKRIYVLPLVGFNMGCSNVDFPD